MSKQCNYYLSYAVNINGPFNLKRRLSGAQFDPPSSEWDKVKHIPTSGSYGPLGTDIYYKVDEDVHDEKRAQLKLVGLKKYEDSLFVDTRHEDHQWIPSTAKVMKLVATYPEYPQDKQQIFIDIPSGDLLSGYQGEALAARFKKAIIETETCSENNGKTYSWLNKIQLNLETEEMKKLLQTSMLKLRKKRLEEELVQIEKQLELTN